MQLMPSTAADLLVQDAFHRRSILMGAFVIWLPAAVFKGIFPALAA
jgi:hypothetical protein